MPLVQQILETSLYCDDLPRAAAFYRGLLGLAPLFEDDRLIALDAGGGTVLLLFRRGGSAGEPARPADSSRRTTAPDRRTSPFR